MYRVRVQWADFARLRFRIWRYWHDERIRFDDWRIPVDAWVARVRENRLEPFAFALERPRAFGMVSFVPVTDHAGCDGRQMLLSERIAQMLHVSLQIAFGSAGEFATIRPSMVFDVVVGVLVERKLQCFALAFSCLWRVPFHDSTPVEVYEQ